MRRRALLSALAAGAAGLAGCSAGGGSTNRTPFGVPDEDPSTDEPTTRTTTTTYPRAVRDPGVEPEADLRPPAGITRAVDWSVGDGSRLVVTPGPRPATPEGTALSVGFVRAATASAPARLWVGLENRADETRTLAFGATPPFSGYYGEADPGDRVSDADVMLIPDDGRNYASYDYVLPENPDGGCWRAVSPAVGPSVRTVVDLPPGHGIAGEYVVLAPNDTPRCLPRHATVEFGDDDEGVRFAVAVWGRDVARPRRSRFDRTERGLPGFERTVWFHEATADTPVYLSPRRERLELPTDATPASLWNYSAAPLRTNPVGWDLYKLHRGRWKHVAPWILPPRSTTIPPGGVHNYPLIVDNRPADERQQAETGAVVSGLGGGLYAFRHGGTVGGAEDPAGVVRIGTDEAPGELSPPDVAYAALVELDGPPVEVRPTPDARVTERGDGRRVVTVGDPADPATLVFDRVADGDPEIELVPEQVMQVPALRNAVGHLTEDVFEVWVRTDRASATEPLDRFVPGSSSLTVRYEGSVYELSVR